MASEDRLRELEEKYEDYKVYDNKGERIGKVDDLFVDESDREEYIGVKMGFFGMKSTLIPTDIVRVNENERSVEVSDSKDHVKGAPSFDDDEDITPDYEDRIRSYFGLQSLGTSESGFGTYSVIDGAEDDTTEYDDRSSLESGEREEPTSEAPEEARGGPGETREPPEAGTTSGGPSLFADEASESVPTIRETEETETFHEGGRRKIRRHVIREEIIDEEDEGNSS